MSIFYILAEKAKSGTKSGNLSSSNYGEFEANSPHFLELSGTKVAFSMMREKPEIPSGKILLKVEADNWEIKNVAMKGKRDGNIIRFQPGTEDATRTHVGNPKSFKVKVISQVMPDGTERYKHNAELDERAVNKPSKPQKENLLTKVGTSILQRAIDLKERNVGKEQLEKPTRKM
jgi:hypothetical protein